MNAGDLAAILAAMPQDVPVFTAWGQYSDPEAVGSVTFNLEGEAPAVVLRPSPHKSND